jgi:hypothetical protein
MTNVSPLIEAKVVLDFPSALKEVIAGHRITKLEWDNPNDFGMLKDGFLMLYRDREWSAWLLNDGDLMGKDWIVL